jgi:hypothetical protein
MTPVFAGYLIVKQIDGDMLTPQEMTYRGPNREMLSAAYHESDGSPPTGWRASVCDELRIAEDPFEFIVGRADAERIFATVAKHDDTYELLACSVEPRIVSELASSDAGRFLARPDADEVAAFLRARSRFAAYPSPPPGPVLGYDVAWFDHGFWSPVLKQVLDGTTPPFSVYRRRVNQFGLFPDAETAREFRDAYARLPEPTRELGDFYVYEVRRPILPGTAIAAASVPN